MTRKIPNTPHRIVRQWLVATAFVLSGGLALAEMAPDAQVRATTEDVLAVIAKTSDRQTLAEVAEAKVVPQFDFRRMTQLAVGRSWSQASERQQAELESEFRNLLVRTYTSALAAARTSRASVEVQPARPLAGADEVLVRSRVRDDGGKSVAIDYSMHRTAAGWKVYDVAVENVSLVTNYRDSFAAEISKGGIDSLVHSLGDKNRESAGKAAKRGAP